MPVLLYLVHAGKKDVDLGLPVQGARTNDQRSLAVKFKMADSRGQVVIVIMKM